jgi:hypothetical protein
MARKVPTPNNTSRVSIYVNIACDTMGLPNTIEIKIKRDKESAIYSDTYQ